MMTEADPNLPQSKTYLFTVAMLPQKGRQSAFGPYIKQLTFRCYVVDPYSDQLLYLSEPQ